ncbi:MAG: hypothetical protein OXH86_09555 [Acidimicrobiaceae bacterium]|nr:hypothetical protein [Acidimicrobiaceae bacterium]
MSMKGMEDSEVLSFNEQIIAEFRANEGRCGGRFEGNPMPRFGDYQASVDREIPLVALRSTG